MEINPEKQLMDALKHGGGLDKEDLSELVKIGSKLMQEIRKGAGTDRAASGLQVMIPWWWKYGQPAISGIAFEAVLDQKGIQNLVEVVNKNKDIANSIHIELTPAVTSMGPEPEPWRVVGKIGAKVTQ